MACRTGEACGLTDTRSGASRCANHSAVIRLTIEALDAWWPPTFTPDGFGRTRLAWCTIEVASHSTRRCTASSVARSIRCSCVTATGESLRAQGIGEIRDARPAAVAEQLRVGRVGRPRGAEAEHALGAEHARGDRPRAQELGEV